MQSRHPASYYLSQMVIHLDAIDKAVKKVPSSLTHSLTTTASYHTTRSRVLEQAEEASAEHADDERAADWA